ncbi:hypothetical protein HDU96_007309 [Phlyctochytrium bullatum]|nr:hypothetical protein HDU96_007309 [Phlyctochytrium bullatum]
MSRKISYKYAFKAILVGKISTPCFEEQEVTNKTDLWISVVSKSNTPHVPYGTMFTVVTSYCLVHAGHGKSHLRMFTHCEFVKPLMLADAMNSTSADGVASYCKELVDALKTLVDKREGEAILTRHITQKRKPSGPRPIQPSISSAPNSLATSTVASATGSAYPTPPNGSPVAGRRQSNGLSTYEHRGSHTGGSSTEPITIARTDNPSTKAAAVDEQKTIQTKVESDVIAAGDGRPSFDAIGGSSADGYTGRLKLRDIDRGDIKSNDSNAGNPSGVESRRRPSGDRGFLGSATPDGALIAAARRKSVELVSILDAAARSSSGTGPVTGTGGPDQQLNIDSLPIVTRIQSNQSSGAPASDPGASLAFKRRTSNGAVVPLFGPRPLVSAKRGVLTPVTDRYGRIMAPERSTRPGGSMGLSARLQPTSGPVSLTSTPSRGVPLPVPSGIAPPYRPGGRRGRRGPRNQLQLMSGGECEDHDDNTHEVRGILDEMNDVASYTAPSIAPSSRSEVRGPRPPNLQTRTAVLAEDFDVKEKLLAAISEELGVLGVESASDTQTTASSETLSSQPT